MVSVKNRYEGTLVIIDVQKGRDSGGTMGVIEDESTKVMIVKEDGSSVEKFVLGRIPKHYGGKEVTLETFAEDKGEGTSTLTQTLSGKGLKTIERTLSTPSDYKECNPADAPFYFGGRLAISGPAGGGMKRLGIL